MSKKRIIIVPPRDGASAEPGYAVNGESIYTRHSAHPKRNVKLSQHLNVNRIERGRHLSDAELKHEYESRLEWLRCEAAMETEPARHAKLKKQIEIKTRILNELKAGAS